MNNAIIEITRDLLPLCSASFEIGHLALKTDITDICSGCSPVPTRKDWFRPLEQQRPSLEACLAFIHSGRIQSSKTSCQLLIAPEEDKKKKKTRR